MSQDKKQNVERLQLLEQSLQNSTSQRVAFQENKAELENAVAELKSSEESYKIVGNLIVKANKEKQLEELNKQLQVINSRIAALKNNEETLKDKIENLRKEVLDKD